MTYTTIWSQITTNPDIQNRHVKYGAEATLGRGAWRTLRTWVMSGVFHNTTGKTLRTGIVGTH